MSLYFKLNIISVVCKINTGKYIIQKPSDFTYIKSNFDGFNFKRNKILRQTLILYHIVE